LLHALFYPIRPLIQHFANGLIAKEDEQPKQNEKVDQLANEAWQFNPKKPSIELSFLPFHH